MHRLFRLPPRTLQTQTYKRTPAHNHLPHRPIHTSRPLRQEPLPTTTPAQAQSPAPIPPPAQAPTPVQQSPTPSAHRNFYKTHGRALFKALTLAFFTYQVVTYMWMVAETEEIMDLKNREIRELEEEVRALDGRRLLEEK